MSVGPSGSNHRIIASHRTVELLGGARTQDVYEIELETLPSLIYFQFRQPVSLGAAPSISARAFTYASDLESVAASPEVVGLAYVQDVSPANQLQDLVEVYVQSTDGSSVDFFRQPLSLLTAAIVAPMIVALQQQLDALLAG